MPRLAPNLQFEFCWIRFDTREREDDTKMDAPPSIPEELICPLCGDLLTDAIMLPCCAISACDGCARDSLIIEKVQLQAKTSLKLHSFIRNFEKKHGPIYETSAQSIELSSGDLANMKNLFLGFLRDGAPMTSVESFSCCTVHVDSLSY